MKFSLAINMVRNSADTSMRDIWRDSLDLLRVAEEGGMETAWAGEHHGIEFWVAPNPFNILADWAARTSKLRLGVGVAVAPYWHPIRLAGETALLDVFSDGRIDLGIARGAFRYESDCMVGDISPEEARSHVFEMVPLLKKLWQGDVVHEGRHWQFPSSTAAPKPVQTPHPPLWIAARDPASFDFAIQHGLSIMSTPLSKPLAEVENLAGKLADALAAHPGAERPQWLVLRTAGVYERAADREAIIDASSMHGKRFGGLFAGTTSVINGFAEVPETDSGAIGGHSREAIADAMVLGTPEEVIEKLKAYEAIGVDSFCYNGCYGLDPRRTLRSLELFVERVMPAFAELPMQAVAS